ncbi:ABC transporter ATP-binding protein [Pseudomonas sp. CFBP 8770]|uniref:ABC transporter ATP-binding protein n=1 Tax=unclassified Pseudomonas TaxID=196821 RepID=UPI0017851635|nr:MULTISPECIES: ABC transporter ATP-binding protein [unclassified Pseudomonas]MBD8475143.1 ABC transporter ATP-binding protein [Pseudomonas sp. CFBP 8773]MBD8645594.1 ABC transporter ATP-binding protein [Pseudomonas sp. CFBP 8770]
MKTATASFDLTLDDIFHQYAGATPAVDHITLEVAAGELVALLGPSGCGKTTLLRIIGGFQPQTSGKVVIGGKLVDHLPAHHRDIGIVFQNYALFPHLSVAENIAYGLDARRVPRSRRKPRIDEMLDMIQLGHLADRYPRQLSGGQQQRVALARALAVEPRILLLDEPFSALDKSLRMDMQIEIKRLQRQSGVTCVMVTHDQEEALSMADRVAVLNAGRLEQFAAPSKIYDSPSSLFVNTFVGNANVLPGTLESYAGESARVRLADGSLLACRTPQDARPGSAVVACIRPENLELTTAGDGFPAQVELGLPLGPSIVHEMLTPGGQRIKIASPRGLGAEPLKPGTQVGLRPISAHAITTFTAPSL